MSTAPDFTVAHLDPLSLEPTGLRRTPPVPEAQRGPGFMDAFDATTLWYDAVRQGGETWLICPKLLNLRMALTDAALEVDGAPARVRRVRKRDRHDLVQLDRSGDKLTLSVGRWRGTTRIAEPETAPFAGLNASLQCSRNNDLRWIGDWARYHVSAQGLEAMVIIDNGSDAYPPEAVAETLSQTGLKRAVVLSAPLPFGPQRSKQHPATAKFLQAAMFNLARIRFLKEARAVLVVDLDELVWSDGPSVFDRAVASPLGYVSFDGRWRLPAPEATPPYLHVDHIQRRKGDKPCPTKYCAVPSRGIGRLTWETHRPEWALVPSRRLARGVGYWHCIGITTDWKGHDRLRQRPSGPEDAATTQAFARHLAPPHA